MSINAMVWESRLATRLRVKGGFRGKTYIDYALDCAEDGCNRRTHEGNGLEDTGLANEDV